MLCTIRCILNFLLCMVFQSTVDKLLRKANVSLAVSTSSWKEQFRDAVTVSAGNVTKSCVIWHHQDRRVHCDITIGVAWREWCSLLNIENKQYSCYKDASILQHGWSTNIPEIFMAHFLGRNCVLILAASLAHTNPSGKYRYKLLTENIFQIS